MSLISRLFGASPPAPAPTPAEQTGPSGRPSLTSYDGLGGADGRLVRAIHADGVRYLEQWSASHLEVIRGRVNDRDERLPAVHLVKAELKSLADSLASWPRRLRERTHESCRSGPDGDVLTTLSVFANASNYDALLQEQALRGATETFVSAVRLATEAYPELTPDEIREVADVWQAPLGGLLDEWLTLEEDRFQAVLAYSGAIRPPIPGEAVHWFRRKPSTHSGAFRPPVPVMSSGRSGRFRPPCGRWRSDAG